VDSPDTHRDTALAAPSWHALTVAEALAKLDSRPTGLSTAEAEKRLKEYGPNLLTPPKPRSPIIRFLLQFHNILIYILLVSGAVKLALGDVIDASVIFGVVIINAIIGFVQEGKAERALAAIRGMLSLNATVVRDGQRRVIPAEQLVPGDVVFLQSGDKVPADLRLISVKSLQIQEAAFTGESVAVEKSIDPVEAAAVPGDRSSMAFSGTLVTYGQGTGVVAATGDRTEIGRIGTMLGEVTAVTTPLLQQVAAFSTVLAILIVGVAAGIFAIGWLVHGQDPNEMFSAAIALAVAAIPEGLPAVMTITLAIGVQRMAKRNAIIRRLPAVETLGSVSVICSDKTGTLTRNEMMVETIAGLGQTFTVTGEGYAPRGYVCLNDEPVGDRFAAYFDMLATAALLCNDAVVRQREDGTYIVEGDPMEGALSVLAMKRGLKPLPLAETFPRTDVIPFESEHQFMATLHHNHTGAAFAIVKGAPERILARCIHQLTLQGEEQPLDLGYWQDQVAAISARGQRVLALARKAFEPGKLELTFGDVESGLTLIGLVGLADPPSSDALAAVAECREAGIRVKMITGDHAGTARAIAKQFNLENSRDVLTGVDLDQLDDDAMADRAVDIDVFARTTPQHKLRLVEALQRKDKIVAMTGDGVNDAPALKKADIGIAMGRRGTEAAKEAAQMVLADDNFASIAHAVEEGRTIYDNLKKAILFLLATNLAQALTILVAVIAGLSLPITAVQILWVNMVVAVTLGLALSFEPTESNVMHRPPRPRNEPLVTPLMLWRITFVATISLIGVFGIYDWKLETTGDVPLARTAAVNMLVGCAAFYLLSARKSVDPLVSRSSLKGFAPALIAIAIITALQLAFTYLPAMQAVFGTRPIGLDIWGEIVAFGVLLCVAAELEKAIVRWRQR
jgi:magnesium-transporting ATPase (P-type)